MNVGLNIKNPLFLSGFNQGWKEETNFFWDVTPVV
jgi:hypothetical protein